MRYLRDLIRRLARLPICAQAGALMGVIAGFTLALVQLAQDFNPTTTELTGAALLITAFIWVVALFLVGVVMHFAIRQSALPTLVNALLASFATVAASQGINVPGLITVAGLIIGALVGAILCALCRSFAGGGRQ